jgi:hypothetical protein
MPNEEPPSEELLNAAYGHAMASLLNRISDSAIGKSLIDYWGLDAETADAVMRDARQSHAGAPSASGRDDSPRISKNENVGDGTGNKSCTRKWLAIGLAIALIVVGGGAYFYGRYEGLNTATRFQVVYGGFNHLFAIKTDRMTGQSWIRIAFPGQNDPWQVMK